MSSNVLTVESNVETPCITHFWSSNHLTADYRTFKSLSIKNKLDVLKEKYACYGWLSPGHTLAECETKSKCDAETGCSEYHHPSLHLVTKDVAAAALSIIDDCYDTSDHVLLPIMKVEPVSKRCRYLSCLWDSAADILFTNTKARQLRLNGKPAKLSVTVAGGHKTIVNSFEYILYLRDLSRTHRCIKVYGFERITNEIGKLELEHVAKQFEGITVNDINRPDGEM